MKIIINKHKWLPIPFPTYKAINLFGVLIVRSGKRIRAHDLNHEEIHTAQMKELLYVPFYIFYLLEYVIRAIAYGLRFLGRMVRDKKRKFRLSLAYRKISFEKEAYNNENNLDYLKTRKPFAFIKHI